VSDTPPARSEAPKRRPLTARRLLWGIAAAFLLLVLVATFGAWRVVRGAQETIEYAALAVLPRGRPPLLEPAQAGEATAVVEAFLAAVEAVPEADREKLDEYREEPAPPEERAAVIAAHPAPVAALASLLHVRSSPPAPPTDVERWWESIPRVQAGLKWIVAAENRAVEAGDGPGARAVSALHVALGGELARSGSLLARVFGGVAERVGAQSLVRAMGVAPVEAEEAKRLRRVLEACDAARLPLSVTFQTDRYWVRAWITAPTNDRDQAVDRQIGWRRLWSWDVYRAEALDGWDAALDAMESALASPDAETTARATPVANAHRGNDLLWANLVTWSNWDRLSAATQSQFQVARTSLAVAEYAARRGSVPAGLSDLVPDFLSAVPADPCDGAPLRYAGGKVWSVGMDGKDDGGTPPADPDDTLGRGGDIVAPPPLVR
jgi:hypothetical protein